MSNVVDVLFRGNAASAVAAAKETEAAVTGVGTKTEAAARKGSGLSTMFTGAKHQALDLAKAFAPVAAALGAAEFAKGAIEGAEKDQAAQARLAAAYKSVGLAIKPYKDSIEEAVAASAKLGFEGAAVKSALGSLIVATHDSRKATDELSTAEDIARFKHISLEAATKTLLQAQTGQQRALKQLGLEVQASTEQQDKVKAKYKQATDALNAQYGSTTKMTDAERARYDQQLNTLKLNKEADLADAKAQDHQKTGALIISQVTEKLHGQADAYAHTAAGAKEVFGAEVDRLQVSLGEGLLPALTAVTGVLADLASFLADHAQLMKIIVDVVAVLTAGYLAYVAATKIAAAAQAALNVVMDANPIGLVVVALAALVAGLIVAYQHSETFRRIVTGAFDAVKAAVTAVADTITDWKNALTTALAAIGTLFATTFGGIKTAIQDAIRDAKTFVHDRIEDIVAFFAGLPDRAKNAVAGIGNTLNAGCGTCATSPPGSSTTSRRSSQACRAKR